MLNIIIIVERIINKKFIVLLNIFDIDIINNMKEITKSIIELFNLLTSMVFLVMLLRSN